jgi:putative tryptophan/tyrosine transport system substrate-binding protein
MRRRDMLPLIGAILAMGPEMASGQQRGRKYLLGTVLQRPRAGYAVLFEELARLGFVEGANLSVDPRGFGLSVERLEIAAEEITLANPDAIFAGGDAAARAAQKAASTIPIVAIADDVVGNQFAASLPRPARNLTGVSILAAELNAKRLELLIELIPEARHIAVLVDPGTSSPDQLKPLFQVARSRDINISTHVAGTRQEIGPAIEEARTRGAEGLNVLASALFYTNRSFIIEQSRLAKLPAMYQFPEFCADGGLAGYGTRISSVFRQVAKTLAKVLAGSQPADLPVEQPTHIELCINVPVANALGLTVPQSLLTRADEVIE